MASTTIEANFTWSDAARSSAAEAWAGLGGHRVLYVSDNLGVPAHARGIFNYSAGILAGLASLGVRTTLLVEARPGFGLPPQVEAVLPPEAAAVARLAEIYRFLGSWAPEPAPGAAPQPAPPPKRPRWLARRARQLRRLTEGPRRLIETLRRRSVPVRTGIVANRAGQLDFLPPNLDHLAHVESFMLAPKIYAAANEAATQSQPAPLLDARGFAAVILDCPHHIRLVADPATRIIGVVHDLIPLTDPQMDSGTRASFANRLSTMTAIAHHLVFVSETTRQNFARLFPAAAARLDSSVVFPPLRREALAAARRNGGPEVGADTAGAAAVPSFVAIVSDEARKNIDRLIEAFIELGPVARLVLIGGVGPRLRQRLKGDPRAAHIQLAGFLADAEKFAHLATAAGVIMPSLSEGFGLPIVEGALFGQPVLCSDLPVFREITAGHALFFDPRSTADIVRALREHLAGPAHLPGQAQALQRLCHTSYGPEATMGRLARLLDLPQARDSSATAPAASLAGAREPASFHGAAVSTA
ncbi:glycosyltransferase [Ancylobacter lacus]|uniref:glycosyltransferase n=1 Tax=Ancylobacter lacus TaxID=2579970 RepID=UPI001BCEB3A0|nr:glycosyltransferase [Ancylobacter lacus]MBS7540142.1 glycosyltransferase [Ancylobacter lacus]